MDYEEKKVMIDTFKKMSTPDLVKEMVLTKGRLETIKESQSRLQEIFDTLRLMVLPEKMDEEGISTITVAGVGRATLQSDIYFSIPATTKDDAYQWLRDNGHGDIIQETVNSSTGKSWAKEMLKGGKILPENLFKVSPFSRAQVTPVPKDK